MTQVMDRPLSLKDLIIDNKDHFRPLHSIAIPIEQRPGKEPKEPPIYDVNYNGGLLSILSKTVSDSGAIKYKVQWANGQQTKTSPSRLRNFYSIVEDYEDQRFNEDDSRQRAPVVESNLMLGYHNDHATDEDFEYDQQRTSTGARKQPRRKTKEGKANYVFGALEELMVEESSEATDTIKPPKLGAHAVVPVVIRESSPTPSPYSSPSIFSNPPANP